MIQKMLWQKPAIIQIKYKTQIKQRQKNKHNFF